MIITESELRSRRINKEEPVVIVDAGDIITPAAQDFIRQHSFRIIARGERASRRVFKDEYGNEHTAKPEQMTHLHGDVLVAKSHPRIRLRGKSDSLQAKILETQLTARDEGYEGMVADLEEILGYIRELLACEVKGAPFMTRILLEMGEAELREISHDPRKHYGVDHMPPHCGMGKTAIALNALRANSREVELAAVLAFADGGKTPERPDLLQAYNRLSSAFYILFCRLLGGWYGRDRNGG